MFSKHLSHKLPTHLQSFLSGGNASLLRLSRVARNGGNIPAKPKTHGQNWTYLLSYKASVSSVQSLSCVQLFATTWTVARQASLFITNSRSLLKLMSIKLVMPSNHLILCCPLLLPPPVFPSIRVFSNTSVLRIRWECELGLAVVQSIKRMIRCTGWFSRDYRGPPLCWLVFWHQCRINHLQLSCWSTRLSRVPKECPYCGTWLMKPWTWSWNARRPSSGRWTRRRKKTLWVQALRWALGINACHFVIVSQVRQVRVVASAWSWKAPCPTVSCRGPGLAGWMFVLLPVLPETLPHFILLPPNLFFSLTFYSGKRTFRSETGFFCALLGI